MKLLMDNRGSKEVHLHTSNALYTLFTFSVYLPQITQSTMLPILGHGINKITRATELLAQNVTIP